ncbi:MAG: M3 family metallopeptidase [Promethearchaeota archaeon]
MTESEMTWDLSPLVDGASLNEVKKLLDDLLVDVESFAEKYNDKIPAMSAPEIKQLLLEREVLLVRWNDYISYGVRRYDADSTDKEAAQLRDWSNQTKSRFSQIVAPYEIRLGELLLKNPSLLEDSDLRDYKHYLERLRNEAIYKLSEVEEQLILQKDVNGVQLFEQLKDSWVSEKLYDVVVNGEAKTISYPELSSLRMNPDRDIRRMATETLYKSISEDRLIYGFALRSICSDHVAIAKLRKHPSPMTQSLLDQDVDKETVETLLSVIESTSDRYRDLLTLKAKVMGVDKLEGSDVIAPMTTEPVWKFRWNEARDLVIDAFDAFDPEAGKIVTDMFDEYRIDAANRKGKSYGAYCARNLTKKSSFILMSYNETMNDLFVLAHELGHAVQGQITFQHQTPLNYKTSACLAEMGSIFGELLLTDKILSMSETKEQKFEILSHVLGGFFYTVYYVGLRALFEKSLYSTIQDGKLLDADVACELWNAAKKRIFADSVDWNEYMEYEWARVPHHFFTTRRFYNYSYSFAQMLVFAQYAIYKQEGPKFAERFRGLLAGGNTKSVRDHLKDFGFDITDPMFWELGAKQANYFLQEFKKLI